MNNGPTTQIFVQSLSRIYYYYVTWKFELKRDFDCTFFKDFEAVKISSPFFETHKVAMQTYFRFSNTDVFLPLLSHFDKPKPVFELQNF